MRTVPSRPQANGASKPLIRLNALTGKLQSVAVLGDDANDLFGDTVRHITFDLDRHVDRNIGTGHLSGANPLIYRMDDCNSWMSVCRVGET